jgi:nicotinamide-nucleotide amidase
MRIEVICTGDEVLSGKVVNSNFSFISQKLGDFGFSLDWETTVGDDRESLLLAFRLASQRADAVIVNGGLGPTVDDLSQEIAAQAAGVSLVLNKTWLVSMELFFTKRGRIMPANNIKQAMLPEGAEVLDNPIGTACGFALLIGKARFYFTPGVPRELFRMLEEQIVPRLLKQNGRQSVVLLKRFHSYGIGESHADELLSGLESLAPSGSVKLGFRAHYPQLETKLTARGEEVNALRAMMAPLENEVRARLGHFIIGEDDQSLEGVIVDELIKANATLSLVETFTAGQISARLMPLPQAQGRVLRNTVAQDKAQLSSALGLSLPLSALDVANAKQAAIAARLQSGSTLGMAILVVVDEGVDRVEFSGEVSVAIADANGHCFSRLSRIAGGREWVRFGAVEMGLDSLRRHLQGLPMNERTDFEKPKNTNKTV